MRDGPLVDAPEDGIFSEPSTMYFSCERIIAAGSSVRHLKSERRPMIYFAALLVALLGVCSTADAQTTTDLFDRTTLRDLRLWVNTRDLAELHRNWQQNTYYPADMEWQGVRIRNVGIRSRGSGSRNPTKLGLKIDFNRYVDGQKFQGLGSLVMDNLWQDPALIREATAMALLSRMDIPTPREAFCRFFINGDYQGVYAIVEPIDSTFVKRVLGESSGNLYEYQWVRNFYGEYPGDDLDAYKELFQPDNHEDDPDSTLYGPLRDMFRAIDGEDDAGWQERVSAYLDLHQFVKFVAIESFLSEIDGILGDWGMNNFYLYGFHNKTVHVILPWDKDESFNDIGSSIWQHANENVIFSRAMESAELKALFLDVVDECAQRAAADDWLLTQIETSAAQISDAAHADPLKSFSNDEYDGGIEFLRQFALQRPQLVIDQTAAARGAVQESTLQH
jgi:spore coat protein H